MAGDKIYRDRFIQWWGWDNCEFGCWRSPYTGRVYLDLGPIGIRFKLCVGLL